MYKMFSIEKYNKFLYNSINSTRNKYYYLYNAHGDVVQLVNDNGEF